MAQEVGAKKIVKAKGAEASELEKTVARSLVEIEVNSKELGVDIKDIHISAVKEAEGPNQKKIVIVVVPFKFLKRVQKVQKRLIHELEKKLNGKHVVIVGQRTILSKAYTRTHPGQLRPRSRNLITVHQALLEDVVYPVPIMGKRLRVHADGTRVIKVLLDPREKEVEGKLKSFTAAYKLLTNKNAEFSFHE